MKRTLNFLLFVSVIAFTACNLDSKKAEEYLARSLFILENAPHNKLSVAKAREVIDLSSKAIALDPRKPNYFRARASGYIHLKRFDSAILDLDEALRLDPKNWLAWMNKGIVFENMQRFPAAEKCYLEALRYTNEATNIHYNLGSLYAEWGQIEPGKNSESIKAYTRAIRLNPDYGAAYSSRGYQKLKMGYYKSSIEDCDKAISLDPTDKISFNNRGLAKYYLKNYSGAIADLQKAITIRPGESEGDDLVTDTYSFNNIANCWFALGNHEQACTYWNKAVDAGYQYKPEWKRIYNIDDPHELIKKYCR